jgi:DNA polymerase-1
MYGRGEKSIAEQLKCDIETARKIKNDVYEGFPAIKQFEEDSLQMAREKGYVTTLWGRKRRLPDMKLPPYEAEYAQEDKKHIPVPPMLSNPYFHRIMSKWKYDDKKQIIEEALINDQIIIKNNGGKIADATRQVINARVQGSAADMTKKALIAINTSKELKELKGQVIVPVHDELILKAPLRYGRVVKDLFADLMSHAADDKLDIPIDCDVICSFEWYGDVIDFDKELIGLTD